MIEKRAAFQRIQHLLPGKRLVFLDESHIKVAQNRRYGWAKRGQKPIVRGTAYARGLTMVGAIAADGPRALQVQPHAVNKANFPLFVRDQLLPNLHPGDILVMDQLKAHKNPEVIAALRKAGVHVLFLPVYSPELNAIEPVWGWVKARISKLVPLDVDQLETVVTETWNQVTDALCCAFIEHCGYALQDYAGVST